MPALKNRLISSFLLDHKLRNPSSQQEVGQLSWIRGIREALGMSAQDLGARMGITGTAVVLLEKSELNETIRLNSLLRAAEALNCDVEVKLVPRIPMTTMIENQARHRAHEIARSVENTMSLEAQSVSPDFLHSQIEEIYSRLLVSRGLWHKIIDARTQLL